MGRTRESFLRASGRVWALGSKKYYSLEWGEYWQFALRVPTITGTRLWVHWYRPEFEPMPGDLLEVDGVLSHLWIQERVNKPPKLNVVLQAFNEEIVRFKQSHHDIKTYVKRIEGVTP